MQFTCVPRDIRGMVDGTFVLIGATFKRLWRFTLTAWLLTFASVAVIMNVVLRNYHSASGIASTTMLPWLVLGIVVFVYLIVAASFARAVCLVVIAREAKGETLTWREALRRVVWERVFRMVSANLAMIGGLIAFAGVPFLVLVATDNAFAAGAFLLCVAVPIVTYLSTRWYFTETCILLEGVGIMEGFTRSATLGKSRMLETFGYIVLFSACNWVLSSSVNLPLTMLLSACDIHISAPMTADTTMPRFFREFMNGMFLQSPLSTIISALTQMLFVPAYTVVMYTDLRARRGENEDAVPPDDSVTLSEGLHGASY